MNKIKAFKIPIVIFIAFVCVAGYGFIVEPYANVTLPVFQKGMTYVTWSPEAFAGRKSDESLALMAKAGINYVSIVPTWYQREYNSTEIRPTGRSPSDSSVRHVIRKAHELGMAVMLKPHVDLETDSDSLTRSDIGFQSERMWQEWCDSYVDFIGHYARIAEENGVEIFCVGTELAFASLRTSMWRERIIPAVKKEYGGQLTYAANWDEYRQVGFWQDLDYAGIDAYFPLSDKSDPGPGEIRQGWQRWVSEIESWHREVDKPVIFTELGYCSAGFAPVRPWEEAMSGAPNHAVQAECYKAALETFWNKPWFYGVYWWNWNTYPGSGGEKNRGYTPQNKLALENVKMWYAKNVGIKLYADVSSEMRERIAVESQKGPGPKGGVTFTGSMSAQGRIYGAPARDAKGRE